MVKKTFILQKKNILIVSPEPWNHIFVSKHHYAVHLAAKENNIYFLNPPSDKNLIHRTDIKNVSSVYYEGFVKGLRFMPRFLQRYFIRKKFNQLQKLCNISFDVVWSFDNSVFFDFSALPKKVYCISHIVDLNQNFEFNRAASSANICFGVCRPILNKLLLYNKKCFFVNHGFNEKINNHTENSIKLPGKHAVKAFYAGNLNIKYLDWKLLEACIEKFQNVDFVFAGPWLKTELYHESLKQKSNFHYLGTISTNDLGYYYSISDLLLIAYKNIEYPEQLTNTHKMMEYLGSGKMILATWTDEYRKLQKSKVIKMAKNSLEFLTYFDEIISDLEKWNGNEKSRSRQEYALNNTYSMQIERIEKLLHV